MTSLGLVGDDGAQLMQERGRPGVVREGGQSLQRVFLPDSQAGADGVRIDADPFELFNESFQTVRLGHGRECNKKRAGLSPGPLVFVGSYRIRSAVAAAVATAIPAPIATAFWGVMTNSRRNHGVISTGSVCGSASMIRDSRVVGIRE